MRLLQTEINGIPGGRPNRNPRPEGWVGDGTTTLFLHNTTPLENAYNIRLECDHPYWQASWYQIAALPPEGPAENRPPVGRPDQPGPKNQTLKLYISTNGFRNVMIAFTLPRTAEARAGAYPFRVVIESMVTDANASAGQKRLTEIPGVLIIRPFYEATVEYVPVERKVGIFRKTGDFEVVVRSQGNDWLYAEVRAGKSQTLIPAVPLGKVSVPPAEPGKESERSVPVSATSKLKVIRGEQNVTALPFQVFRVEAPSVPPLPEEALSGGAANLGANVLFDPTKEELIPAEIPNLIYCPPIPASFTEFIAALIRNAKGLALLVVGTFFIGMMTLTVYEREWRKIDNFILSSPGTNKDGLYAIPNGGKFIVGGTFLKGAVLELYFNKKEAAGAPDLTLEPDSKSFRQIDKRAIPNGQEYGEITVDLANFPDVKDLTITQIVSRRRIPVLGTWLMPEKQLKKSIVVGSPQGAKAPIEASVGISEVAPGGTFKINGKNAVFGETAGKVLLGGDAITSGVKWTAGRIEVTVPPTQPVGPQTLEIELPDGRGASFQVRVVADASGGSEISGATDANGNPTTPIEIPEGGPATPSGDPTKPTPEGGSSGSTTAAVVAPGYPETLTAVASGVRRSFEDAALAASSGTAQSLALKAFALAAAGKPDKAEALIGDAKKASQSTLDEVYVQTASAKLAEVRDPSQGQASYRQALKQVGEVSEGGGRVFPILAMAAYLKDVKNDPVGARGILARAKKLGTLTESEQSAIKSLESRL